MLLPPIPYICSKAPLGLLLDMTVKFSAFATTNTRTKKSIPIYLRRSRAQSFTTIYVTEKRYIDLSIVP